jgi:error-prone DNA polymerase
MDYAELACRSNFSFLQGASHPEDLVARAHALGYKALALTDEASVSGSVRAHLAAESLGIQVIHGAQFVLSNGLRLAFLVRNRSGWAELCRLITLGRRRADKGQYSLSPEDFSSNTMANCLVLWLPSPIQSEASLHPEGRWMKAQFGSRVSLAYSLWLRADDRAWQQQLITLGALLRMPLVATGDVLMHRRSQKPLADLLTAIRMGCSVAECGQALSTNAERALQPRLRMARRYPAEHLQASLALAEQCQFSLSELRYEYPDEIVPTGLTPAQWLRHLTEEGARQRFPPSQFPQGMPAKVRQQIEHELSLIADLQYEPYFLTVYDIVAFARSRGILCQGRGSAANSAVCYCLGITEVDPSRMSMLFERFISKERNEPPDIDVDFEHQRREEVIQYLYTKYGRERAALTAALIRYRPRSALRDSGKALGLSPILVDLAAKGRSWWEGKSILAPGLQASIEEGLARLAQLPQTEALPSPPSMPELEQWARMANQLLGFPRHLSQHVGGFVIARHSLSELVPIENAAMPERSIIQWDKDDIDALGLLKVDVLALGMLSAIQRALHLVGQKLGLQGPLPMQEVPAEDEPTYQMIQAADTVGVFQIESRAQMSMLPRLKPACFYDLVIEVAIVRPGPIQGGMVHPYLRRRQGLEPVEFPSPAVRSALERTLGVPIFQEQVMQLAILAAGFTPGEADQLRRAMAAWRRRGSLGPFEDRLINGMLMRGYTRDFAERVFAQIQGFGEYGFPESHAASFALLVYVSCWLKRHHPDAFLAALLNSQPMGFYAPAQLVRDARAHGVEVRAVDVQHSTVGSSLEPPPSSSSGPLWAVRLGLNRIAQLPEEAMERIVQARLEQGRFQSVEDLAQRAALSRTDLQALAAANALESLAGHRHVASWVAAGHEPMKGVLSPSQVQEPRLAPSLLPEPTEASSLVSDYASLGLTLGRHPIALIRDQLRSRFKSVPALELKQMPSDRLARATGLVTHRQRPGTAKGVVFMTLEDETGSINLIVWPDVLARFKQACLQGQVITAYGRWQTHHLVSLRIEDHTALLAQALGGVVQRRSRDFH